LCVCVGPLVLYFWGGWWGRVVLEGRGEEGWEWKGSNKKGREKGDKRKIPVTFKLPQTKVDSNFLY
jgi:hypothetical protein